MSGIIYKRYMRLQRGFTLVEILAVVVILAIIAMIAIPVMTGIIQKTRTNAIVANAFAIKDASNLYVKESVLQHKEVGTSITYKDLVTSGFLDGITDPDTGESWDLETNQSYVTVDRERVLAICLRGEKRDLCSRIENGTIVDGPVPVQSLSGENVTKK